jgi:uncharacterized membrane protein YwaF
MTKRTGNSYSYPSKIPGSSQVLQVLLPYFGREEEISREFTCNCFRLFYYASPEERIQMYLIGKDDEWRMSRL